MKKGRILNIPARSEFYFQPGSTYNANGSESGIKRWKNI